MTEEQIRQHQQATAQAKEGDRRTVGRAPVRAKLRPEHVAGLREKMRQYQPHDLFGPEARTASGQHWTVEDLVQALQR